MVATVSLVAGSYVMRRPLVFLVSLVAILFLLGAGLVNFASAQVNCDAFHGAAIPDSQIDGVIGSEWDDAGSYSNVSINPYGVAHLWVKQDGTYLYLGLRFYADSENPWVAFQFGSSFCMSTSADGALFRKDNSTSVYSYLDIYFSDQPAAVPDSTQNGVGAISVNSSRAVVVELKKPLNSGDSAGKDINWTQGGTYTLVIMWDSDGGGSSGGSANHSASTPTSQTTQTITLSSDSVPEFPSSLLFFSIIALALPAFALAKLRLKRYDKR